MEKFTYDDVIKSVGIEKFKEYGKGWYDFDIFFDNFVGCDYSADRYAIYGYLPFYMINQFYNEAYEADNDIGSTYDWLGDTPTEKEIEWFSKIDFDQCQDFKLVYRQMEK